MLLAIDVGNTQTVIGLIDGPPEAIRVSEHWRVATNARHTADELMLQLQGLLRLPHPDGARGRAVTGVAVCSTVPAVVHELRDVLRRYFPQLPCVVVEPGMRTALPLAVDNPLEVGTDRIVNALAARHLYGAPCIVVDFGTATTFDVISVHGEYVGGAIAPGIGISVDALAQRGAQLRKVELVRPRSVVGSNTVEALQSGVVYGFAGQVDGLVRRMATALGHPLAELPVVATGGLAAVVLEESETVRYHEPWLTLVGLRLVHDQGHSPGEPTR